MVRGGATHSWACFWHCWPSSLCHWWLLPSHPVFLARKCHDNKWYIKMISLGWTNFTYMLGLVNLFQLIFRGLQMVVVWYLTLIWSGSRQDDWIELLDLSHILVNFIDTGPDVLNLKHTPRFLDVYKWQNLMSQMHTSKHKHSPDRRTHPWTLDCR